MGVACFCNLAPGAAIHLNQLGYTPTGHKAFRVSQSSEQNTYSILDINGTSVFSGRLSRVKQDDLAGERVQYGIFSSFAKPGRYRIQLPQGETPSPFVIGRHVYEDLYRHAIHALYLSRCGYAVVDERVGHPACHLTDGGKVIEGNIKIDDARDVQGAWHNGGDYRRSTLSAAQTINRLLWVVECFEDRIHETESLMEENEGEQTEPDLLAEIRWGLDWLMRMMTPDGGVSLGLGPAPEAPFMPPFIPPHKDMLHNYLGSVYSANTFKTGAVLARAARLLKQRDPDWAHTCLDAAERIWGFLESHPDKVQDSRTCQIYKFNNTDAEDRLWLAVELFRATGKPHYDSYFKSHYYLQRHRFPPYPVHTHVFRMYNYRESLVSYVMDRHADRSLKSTILNDLTTSADQLVSLADSTGFGSVLAAPHWQHRHTIGNALHLAFELIMTYELTSERHYMRVVKDQFDYLLGVNPLDQLYITGFGDNSIQAPHYRPCVINDRTPIGFTVKGPTHDATFIRKNYTEKGRPLPPPMKAYIDERHAHGCNEPDIEVQGYLAFFAGYFHFAGTAFTLDD